MKSFVCKSWCQSVQGPDSNSTHSKKKDEQQLSYDDQTWFECIQPLSLSLSLSICLDAVFAGLGAHLDMKSSSRQFLFLSLVFLSTTSPTFARTRLASESSSFRHSHLPLTFSSSPPESASWSLGLDNCSITTITASSHTHTFFLVPVHISIRFLCVLFFHFPAIRPLSSFILPLSSCKRVPLCTKKNSSLKSSTLVYSRRSISYLCDFQSLT